MDKFVVHIQEEIRNLSERLQCGDPEMYGFINTKIIIIIDCLMLLNSNGVDVTESLQNITEAQEILSRLEDENSCGYKTETFHTGDRGRPAYNISKEQLESLMEQEFSLTDIASLMGVSERTVHRRCREYGLKCSERFSQISDEGLDTILKQQKEIFPNMGHRMMCGVLRHLGHHLQRQRVLDSMKRVDPIGNLARSLLLNVAPRRSYSVFSPQALWHLDGHHKLIRWRLVIHGGMDGYSRRVVYLTCNNNNKADTVLHSFIEATQIYGVPSRIRTDKGGENMEIARFMLNHPDRGPGRGSVITGPSTHNTRIERFWRDLFSGCLYLFYQLFYFMEDQGILDPNSETHLWCLHFVFVERINQSLTLFKNGYNKHKIRTAHNKSPEQLWTEGILRVANSSASIAQDIFREDYSPEDFQAYGIDYDAPLHTEPAVHVEVPVTPSPITSDHNLDTINVLRPSDCYGIDIFEEVLNHVQHLQSI